MDCSLPGSSVHGIFQATVLEWVAISFSRASSWPGDWTWVSRIAGRGFTIWATREARKKVRAVSVLLLSTTRDPAWWGWVKESEVGAEAINTAWEQVGWRQSNQTCGELMETGLNDNEVKKQGPPKLCWWSEQEWWHVSSSIKFSRG